MGEESDGTVLKWAETYVKPEEKDADNKIKARELQLEFDNAQFWWGNAPVTNLMRLLKMQSDGWLCGLDIKCGRSREVCWSAIYLAPLPSMVLLYPRLSNPTSPS